MRTTLRGLRTQRGPGNLAVYLNIPYLTTQQWEIFPLGKGYTIRKVIAFASCVLPRDG